MMITCPICSAPPGEACRGASQLHEQRVNEMAMRRALAAEARLAELEVAISKAIAASDNDGGSASDAIQDMLEILREALEPTVSAQGEVARDGT